MATAIGSEDNDTIAGSPFPDDLRGRGGNDILEGRGGNDLLYGDEGNDILFGGADSDRLFGGPGNDILFGEDGRDVLNGGAGNDILDGGLGGGSPPRGAGNDILIGGAGGDRFGFGGPLNASANVDTIGDFSSGVDCIELNDAVFAGLAEGALDASAFATGAAAQDAADRIIYDPVSGNLYFDADGTGAAPQVLFAVLAGAPPLAAGDFIVV